ncbi:MAG: hypothetical protein JWP89_4356, partial [Schlesneria sp.]|nr:hypothetical protein [Schlesneria sp.]
MPKDEERKRWTWTYPRNVGARLGLEGLLEVNGGEIPEFRVPSDTVVKDFDVF